LRERGIGNKFAAKLSATWGSPQVDAPINKGSRVNWLVTASFIYARGVVDSAQIRTELLLPLVSCGVKLNI